MTALNGVVFPSFPIGIFQGLVWSLKSTLRHLHAGCDASGSCPTLKPGSIPGSVQVLCWETEHVLSMCEVATNKPIPDNIHEG